MPFVFASKQPGGLTDEFSEEEGDALYICA